MLKITTKEILAQFFLFNNAIDDMKVKIVNTKKLYIKRLKCLNINPAISGVSSGIFWNSSPENIVVTIITCMLEIRVVKPEPIMNIHANTVTNVDFDSTPFSFFTLNSLFNDSCR